jgi:hypothetical protein
MVCFQTKNPNLGKFWWALEWKMLLYFMSIWNTSFMDIWHNVWQFGMVYGHLVYFFPFWYVWTKKNLATLAANDRRKKEKNASSPLTQNFGPVTVSTDLNISFQEYYSTLCL